jgi:nifR3 family TIM-barrel protein
VKIGNVETGAPVRLAPMAGFTNAPFRKVARNCGSGLVTSEELDSESYVRNNPRATLMARHYPDEHPIAMQILGVNIPSMVTTAERLQDEGADLIDINMGCPMPKITRKGKGSALMRDLPHTAEMLRSIRAVLSIPLTIKIRGGWNYQSLNAVEVALMAEAEGVDGITVHPRTQSQRFTGKAPWEIITDVVNAVKIPVTGNGDVTSMADASRMMAETGCKAVMIGRAAQGRPWIFDAEFENLSWEARLDYKRRVIDEHLRLISEHFEDRRRLSEYKIHLANYITNAKYAKFHRADLFRSTTEEEVMEVFELHWEAAMQTEREQAAYEANRALHTEMDTASPR